MTARTAALLYTSADAEGAQGGGFKVTSFRGDLAESELAELVGYRPGAGGLDDDPLPQFATPEQVSRGPRALDFRAVLDGVAWWHVAPAGSDSTGRGSNQVMHVAFASGPLGHRPVESWRSPDWKTPFGRDQVAAASLRTAVLPAVQPGMSRDAVLDGLAGARSDALETLLVVIDVVVGALETGELVLLAVDDADDAAWWMAAVTHLLPLASSQRVTFSILADASVGGGSLVDMLRGDGIVVGCVDRKILNAEEVPPDVALVDTAAPVVLGLGGEDHHVGSRRLASSEMSALALELLVDPELAVAAMAWVDQTLDPTVEPRWALAASLLRDPERYADAVAGAARLLVTHAPPVIPQELQQVADSALDVLMADRDAEGLWAVYTQLGPTNAFRPAVARAYVRRALTEPAWLDRIEVPSPTELLELPESRAALEALAEGVRAEVGAVPERALLNAVALLTQVGAIQPQHPTAVDDYVAREQLADILASRVALDAPPSAWDLLRDAPAPLALRSVLAELTVELVKADDVVRDRPLGARLDERLTLWLVPNLRDVFAGSDHRNLVVAEHLVRSSVTFPPGSVDLTRAFEAAVQDREGGGVPAPVLGRFDELDHRAGKDVLERRGSHRRLWLDDRGLAVFLLTAPWDAALERLCDGYERLAPDAVRTAAQVRLRSRRGPWVDAEAGSDLASAVTDVLALAPSIVGRVDDHVLALLQVVHCRAELAEAGSSNYIGTFGAMSRALDRRLVGDVQAAILTAVTPTEVLVAQLRATWAPHQAPRIPIQVSDGDGHPRPLLEVLARQVLAGSDDLPSLIASVQAVFPASSREAVESALLQLAPRGAKLAQSGQKLADGVRNLFGLQRSEYEEKR